MRTAQPRRGGEVELAAHRDDVDAARVVLADLEGVAGGGRGHALPRPRPSVASRKWHSPPSTARSDPCREPASRHRRGPAARRRRASRSCASTAAGRSRCDDHFARLRRTCDGPAARGRPRRAARARSTRCSSAAGAGRRRCCASCSRAAGGGSRSSSRCPQRPAGRARGDASPTRRRACSTASRRSPTPATCSPGGSRKEQGYDEALLVTPHGRVLEGPTWTFFWVARRRAAARRRSRTASSPRSRATRLLEECERRGGARARSTTCARPRRRSSPRPCARSCRSRRSTTSSCRRRPGPVTRDAHAALPAPRRARAGARRRPSAAPARGAAAPPVCQLDVPEHVAGGAEHALYGSANAGQTSDAIVSYAAIRRVTCGFSPSSGTGRSSSRRPRSPHRLREVADEVLVHTGQHYDDELSQVFFDELGLPRARAPARPRRRLATPRRRRACWPRSSRCWPSERARRGARLRRHELDAGGRAGRRAGADPGRARRGGHALVRPRDAGGAQPRADRPRRRRCCCAPSEARGARTCAPSGSPGEIEVVGDVMVDVALLLGPRARDAHRGARGATASSRAATCSSTAHRAGNVDDPGAAARGSSTLLAALPRPGRAAAAPAHRARGWRRPGCSTRLDARRRARSRRRSATSSSPRCCCTRARC